MKKVLFSFVIFALVLSFGFVNAKPAEARGRYGSIRVGGYNSHGKGSHYIGGYVRSGPAIRYSAYRWRY